MRSRAPSGASLIPLPASSSCRLGQAESEENLLLLHIVQATLTFLPFSRGALPFSPTAQRRRWWWCRLSNGLILVGFLSFVKLLCRHFHHISHKACPKIHTRGARQSEIQLTLPLTATLAVREKNCNGLFAKDYLILRSKEFITKVHEILRKYHIKTPACLIYIVP